MPKINDVTLPEVKISGEADFEALASKLEKEDMPLEAMIELAIYLKRQMDKPSGIEASLKVLRKRIADAYGKMKPEFREIRRTNVGMATYSEGGEKVVLKDRDWTFDHLTPDQIRATYQPDLKALETILKPAEFNRHVKREKKDPSVSIREQKGVEDYEELDF